MNRAHLLITKGKAIEDRGISQNAQKILPTPWKIWQGSASPCTGSSGRRHLSNMQLMMEWDGDLGSVGSSSRWGHCQRTWLPPQVQVGESHQQGLVPLATHGASPALTALLMITITIYSFCPPVSSSSQRPRPLWHHQEGVQGCFTEVHSATGSSYRPWGYDSACDSVTA